MCTQFCLISLIIVFNKYFWIQETEKLAWFSVSLKGLQKNMAWLETIALIFSIDSKADHILNKLVNGTLYFFVT